MNTKELCPICGEGHVTLRVDQVESECKGKKAMLPLHYQVCDVCTSDFAGMEESRLNKRAVMAFRKSVDGLLTGDEIRSLRDKYKLTQSQAAKLFGGGPVAFSKYENDDVAHSEAMDTLLRLVRRSEATFWDLVDEKGMASEFTYVKYLEKIVDKTTSVMATNEDIFYMSSFDEHVFRSSSSSSYTTISNDMKQWKQ